MPLRGLTSIRVDFGWDRLGTIRAFKDDATGPLSVGDVVRCWDDDGTERLARILSEDATTVQMHVLPVAEAGALEHRTAAG